MPSKTSTLPEPGWLPFTDHLDIIRIAYFIHLQKLVYNELQTLYVNNDSTSFNCIKCTKSILIERGVDYMLNDVER